MQQQWETFWQQVTETFHHALSPFRAIAELLGFSPSDMQIWCFLCGVFIAAIVVPYTYGDLVLARRRHYATGRVVKIDTSGDTPHTPTIEFTDRSGRRQRFDSNLQVNPSTGPVGAAVEVMYDPLNPKIAREVGRPIAKAFNLVFWYMTVFGLFAMSFLLDDMTWR